MNHIQKHTLADEAEPLDDNIMFQEGGESFTGTEAVNAAMNVALLLNDNGERGFEPLFEAADWEEFGSRTLAYDVLWEALCRLAYIGYRPGLLSPPGLKAASVLGGVTAWPPIIPGKAGRSKIGYVHSSVVASFVRRLLRERGTVSIVQKFASEKQARQIEALVMCDDDNKLSTVCNAALAGACVAHMVEKKLCSPDLTWHHFRGGCWATGNFPTWQ